MKLLEISNTKNLIKSDNKIFYLKKDSLCFIAYSEVFDPLIPRV